MAKLTVEIDLSNAAMQEPCDVADALDKVSRCLIYQGIGPSEGKVYDVNRNTVGEWKIAQAFPIALYPACGVSVLEQELSRIESSACDSQNLIDITEVKGEENGQQSVRSGRSGEWQLRLRGRPYRRRRLAAKRPERPDRGDRLGIARYGVRAIARRIQADAKEYPRRKGKRK